MSLPDITEYFMPLVVIACLIVGYVIKQTPLLVQAIPYIPIILSVLGAVLGIWILGFSLEAITAGAFSGLASTGLHQAFSKLINNNKEEEK